MGGKSPWEREREILQSSIEVLHHLVREHLVGISVPYILKQLGGLLQLDLSVRSRPPLCPVMPLARKMSENNVQKPLFKLFARNQTSGSFLFCFLPLFFLQRLCILNWSEIGILIKANFACLRLLH